MNSGDGVSLALAAGLDVAPLTAIDQPSHKGERHGKDDRV